MSAVERLRELTALQGSYKAEISACLSYLNNHDRWVADLERELKILEWQQRRVDMLRQRYGPEGEAHLADMQSRLAQVSHELAHVKNQAQIETMLRLAREIDALNGTAAAMAAAAKPTMAACDAADKSDQGADVEGVSEPEEILMQLVCDACGHRTMGSEDLIDTACSACKGGILVDPENSDDIDFDEPSDEDTPDSTSDDDEEDL